MCYGIISIFIYQDKESVTYIPVLKYNLCPRLNRDRALCSYQHRHTIFNFQLINFILNHNDIVYYQDI